MVKFSSPVLQLSRVCLAPGALLFCKVRLLLGTLQCLNAFFLLPLGVSFLLNPCSLPLLFKPQGNIMNLPLSHCDVTLFSTCQVLVPLLLPLSYRVIPSDPCILLITVCQSLQHKFLLASATPVVPSIIPSIIFRAGLSQESLVSDRLERLKSRRRL